jgi:hypothetical protein
VKIHQQVVWRRWSVTKLASITFLSLAFSYWIDNLGFTTEGRLAAMFFIPSLGVPNWSVIYIINIAPSAASASRATLCPTFLHAESLYMGRLVFYYLLVCYSSAAAATSSSLHFLSPRSPQAFHPRMSIKKVEHRAAMVKKYGNKMALKWVPLMFEESDLKKAKKDGFLPEAASIVFPGKERVPSPLEGYRVMFLSFLLCSLSLPTHEFLRGLLFVYGMQLHQLTPNSILHIACFITLCESFLGMNPHWVIWRFLFCLRPSIALNKKPELVGAVVSV